MRRIWAALLVVVFSFALIGPDAFAGLADRKLPACCRSNGKHHCSLSQNEGSSGPAVHASRCALFGGDRTMPPIPIAAAVKLSPAVFGAVSSHPTRRLQIEALRRITFDRSAQKRGPPFLS